MTIMNRINKILKSTSTLKVGMCVLLLSGAVGGAFAQEAEKAPAQPAKKAAENLLAVRGRVMDAATHRPVVGARVQMLDRNYSAMTNENGVFNLQVPSLSAIVEVSAEDYATREIPLHGETTVDFSLYSSTFKTQFRTIETAAGARRASSISAPVAQASSIGQAGAISVEQEIATQLGTDVRTRSHSAMVGNGAAMFIRGINSLNASSQPLIVVDGVLFDNQLDRTSIIDGFFYNPLSSIDVEDIASVTVLKDGSAIYGSKGSNGVILIKTKRGESQATRITFSAFAGFNEKPKLPDMMNAAQYRKYASELLRGDDSYTDYDKVSWLSEDNSAGRIRNYATYHNDTDWSDETYRNSVLQSYNIAVNGGDEVALYNLSVGFTSAPSTIKETQYSRLNARFNSDIQMFTRLGLGVDISYTQTNRDQSDDGAPEDYTSDPVTSAGFLGLIKSPILSTHAYDKYGGSMSDLSKVDVFGVSNPLGLFDKGKNRNETNHMNIAFTPKYTLAKDMVVSSLFSYTLDKTVASYFRPQDFTPVFSRGTTYAAKNTVKTLSAKQVSLYSDTRWTWKKNFENNNFDFLAGFRYTNDTYKSDWAAADNTANNNVKTISASMNNKSADGVDDQAKTLAVYGNVDYNWLNRYFLTGTFSFDTSSRFGDKVDGALHIGDNSFGFFPSLQGAWVISSEEFMKPLTAISLLKLRAGYSITGNDDILYYGTTSYYSAFRFFNRFSGLELTNIGNETLGWETSHKFNVGLDMSFLKDRLSLSVDAYHNRTTDLLTLESMTAVSGLDSYWTNNGTLENNGIEVSARAKVLNLRNFKWELGASISHYKNEIKSLAGTKTLNSYSGFEGVENTYYGASIVTSVGNAAGLFYGYKTNGVYAKTSDVPLVNGERIYNYNTSTGVKTYFEGGDVAFVDQNHDGKIDELDRVVIGDPNPDYTGSINSHMKWGRLSFDALFTFSEGNDVYNYLRSQIESASTYYNQTLAVTNAWSYEGQVTNMPRISYGDPMGNNRFSDRWIEDGSYFRLKTIRFAYDMPFNLPFLQGITVWASANNLWTATKYLGSDPEFSSSNSSLYQGIDTGLLANGRSYYLGVKINL